MEDEKFKDLLEDEELKLLRLAALATKQKKQQLSKSTEGSAALPINSIITSSASGSENASNQIPFVQSERNAFNNNSWRKQNHPLRRRGGAFPKSNQRSNLIVINPIAPNEGKDLDKNVPALMLPQHKWCNSANEDSMSPKTLRRTGPTRFNRHGSDSESSESDLENDIDSGSNETVLQDEPPEHFSHLSSDSDAVSENVEKKRRLSFQNLDSDIQTDALDKSETTSIYNVLKNPSNSISETASGQKTRDVNQAWSHSAEEEYSSYKHNNNNNQRETSDNFAKKQIHSSIVAIGNEESQVDLNRVQPGKTWSEDAANIDFCYSKEASYYSREAAYNTDHKNKFGGNRIDILYKDDLRHQLKKHMKEELNPSSGKNQNGRFDDKGYLDNTIWDRNRPKTENADAAYSNVYENEQDHSNFSRSRNVQNFDHGKDEHHISLSHRRHRCSLSSERNKKDVSNFDYSSGLERNSTYDPNPINNRDRFDQNSNRESCEINLNRNWYRRSSSRGRHERSSSRSKHEHSPNRSRHERSSSRSRHEYSLRRSKRECNSGKNRHERSSSRSRHERSSSRSRGDSNFNRSRRYHRSSSRSRYRRSVSRSRHERSSSRRRNRSSSRTRQNRSSSSTRHDRSSSRTRQNRSSSRTRQNRSSSSTRHDRSSSRTRQNRSSSSTRHDRSSSRTRQNRSSSSTRHDRSSSRTRQNRSPSSTRRDRSSSRARQNRSSSSTRHDRSSSRSEYDHSSSRSRYNRSSSRSSRERSSSKGSRQHENSSSRDLWKNERNINEGGIKYESFQDLNNQEGRSSPSAKKDKYSFHEEENKHSRDQDKNNHEHNTSQDKNIAGHNSCQNRLKSEISSSPNKAELDYTSSLHSRHENRLHSEQLRNKSKHSDRHDYSIKSRLGESQNKSNTECQDGKHEQKSFEKRKRHSLSHEENTGEHDLNEKKNRHKLTLKSMNMYNKPNFSQQESTHDIALNLDKTAVGSSKQEQPYIQMKKPEKTNKFEKSSRKEKSKSVEKNCNSSDNSKSKMRQKSSRGSNSRNQYHYSRSRSSSCSSSSSSYSSSSSSSKPKIRSVSSVIKPVPPKSFDSQNKQSSYEIKIIGTINTSLPDASSKKNINGDHNKVPVVKSSRMDVDFKACDNSKRVPVHMRLGVLPRKRVIQMPKDVEAAFVNSSSSSDGENVNTKCKRQNIRIVTDVTDAKQLHDKEMLDSEKEKSPKRSPPNLNQEKSKRLKIKR